MAKYRNYWIMIIFHSLAIASLKDGFENLQWGKRILGRLLTTVVKVSPIECAEECLTRPGCLSFNYRRAAIFCELNYVSGNSSDTKPVDDDGWIFSVRNTWPKEITGACKDAVCSLNEQCKRGALGTYNCTLSHCHPSDLTISPEIKPFQSKIAVDFNSVHKLECKDGYIQVSGDGKIKCQQNGTWTGHNIRCRGKCQI
ncbi:uncharacterized protein LOC133193852 [Saccostrea echinata]|uniref:uncharacterized protein LOC133193852 n=1 Tax=Saccostrea echinata TaxID=191078 RepID=UPI002A837A70|nr:uncharacterized protein LOC133193852 [Saccostrea echinata]